MASWKKVIALDTTPSAENSFVTVNTDDSVEVIRFGDLPEITPGANQSVGEVISDDATNYLFVVEDEDANDHKKITFDDIVAALATGMVGGLPADQAAYYTGDVNNLAADLNDDGSVSTADLLEFLTSFGEIGNGFDTSVRLTTTASVALDDSNAGLANAEVMTFTVSDSAITAGQAALTVDGTNNKLVFSNAASGSNQEQYFFDGNSNRRYKFFVASGADAFSANFTQLDERLSIFAKIESFDAASGGDSLGSSNHVLVAAFSADNLDGPHNFSIDGADSETIFLGGFNSAFGSNVKRAEISFYAYTDNGTDTTVEISDIDVMIMKDE